MSEPGYEIKASGVFIPAKAGRKMPDPVPGQHLWTLLTVHQIDPLDATTPGREVHLDHETLLTIAGPGCFWCEEAYSRKTASTPCPGDVS